MRTAQRAGNSRGYAQFEQKLYEQILKVHKLLLHRKGAVKTQFALWPYFCVLRKRPGEKARMSWEGARPWIRSVIICAVMGARRMPLRKWPVAANMCGVLVGPMMGKSSGVPGRKPAQLWMMGAEASAGRYFAAAETS